MASKASTLSLGPQDVDYKNINEKHIQTELEKIQSLEHFDH